MIMAPKNLVSRCYGTSRRKDCTQCHAGNEKRPQPVRTVHRMRPTLLFRGTVNDSCARIAVSRLGAAAALAEKSLWRHDLNQQRASDRNETVAKRHVVP